MRGLLLILGLCVLGFTGCSGGSRGRPFEGQTLNVFNWESYIDSTVLREFEEQTGATVQYDNYSSDEEMLTKLSTGGGGYDVAFPSDHALGRLIRQKRLAEIDRQQLPNWEHLDPRFLAPQKDPDNRYTVPYFWGTLALGINTKHVKDPVTDFGPLFDARYKGRIVMMDEMEHAIAAALLYLGRPMNSTRDEDLAAARALLLKQRPLVQAYTRDDYRDRLASGEAWVALGWNGDLAQAKERNPNLKVVVPEKGTLIWADSMVILREAPHPELAHAFINFLLTPEVAVRNAHKVRYATPNRTARSSIEPSLLNDLAIYPPKDVLDRCTYLDDKGQDIRKLEAIWREIRN